MVLLGLSERENKYIYIYWSNLLCASNETHVTHYGFVRNNVWAWAGLGNKNVESKMMKDATHPWCLERVLGGGEGDLNSNSHQHCLIPFMFPICFTPDPNLFFCLVMQFLGD